MLICHHCRHEFEATERAATAICPRCRSEVRVPEKVTWVSVVKTINLAEAGYLANELEAGGFHVQIKQHDSFSAVDGSWTSLFLIQTPAEEAQAAADHLRAQLTESELAGPLAVVEEYAAGTSDRGAVVWRPLALMVVAGAAVLFIGYKMRELRIQQQDPPTRARLLHALEQIDRPFVSEDPGQAVNQFRLLFSRPGRTWRLQEDTDGDGRYDREWRFHGAAVRH